TARLASCRAQLSATARLPSAGKTGLAWCVPAITANATPSRIASIAAAVATRASAILDCGAPIDPEQSMMMTSAPSVLAVAAGGVSGEVTVTIALTSLPPTDRYSFWKTWTVKPASLIVISLPMSSGGTFRRHITWAGNGVGSGHQCNVRREGCEDDC